MTMSLPSTRRRVTTAVSAAIVLFAWTAGGSAQFRRPGGAGLTVFVDPGFGGSSSTLRDDVPNFQSLGLNDRVSSLQVASGETWEVCENANYVGPCRVFSGDEQDLRRIGWNDKISSARRVRGGFGRGGGGGAERGLELFARVDFAGDRRVFANEVSNLQFVGFNDEARSLRVARSESWEVCADANYRNCITVNADSPDLSQLGMSRKISSLRPVRRGRGDSRPEPAPDAGRLTLFALPNFRGRAETVERELASMQGMAARVQSVQVSGGSWQICDRPDFRGRCYVVSNAVPDLARIGFRNGIASARPR